jgi:hypothetical protein
MDTQSSFGFKELLSHLIGDMAKAIAERAGETVEQQFARSQAAVHTIMAFTPRDAIEVMIAGHCVMFHELIVDSVRDTMRDNAKAAQRGARSNIVAMDKAFGDNLERLERYQARRAEGRRDVAEGVDETEIGDRVHRHRETPVQSGGLRPERQEPAAGFARARVENVAANGSGIRAGDGLVRSAPGG